MVLVSHGYLVTLELLGSPVQYKQNIKTKTDSRAGFTSKMQNNDFFSKETDIRHAWLCSVFLLSLGTNLSYDAKSVRFCLHTQTTEEGLHKNFHKLDSTHLAKPFSKDTVLQQKLCNSGCVCWSQHAGQELTRGKNRGYRVYGHL